MHVCRIQEGYLPHTRGVITILYKKTKILEAMGIQRNKYVWCVMNKIINDKICTIISNVDNLNL